MQFCTLCALFALLAVVHASTLPPKLVVGAFNIQVFGPTKSSKDLVMGNITKIVSKYDIILIQEIRDKSQKTIFRLLDRLNEEKEDAFAVVYSGRLGRTTSKEQYAYYYRPDVVTVIGTHQFNDTKDVFEREPFSVHITAQKNDRSLELGLTGIHAKPKDVPGELSHMEEVYVDAKNNFTTDNMLIMGDLNADCSYLKQSELENTKLFNDPKYESVIHSADDTTTSATDCAYDRIIVTGADLMNHEYKAGIEHFQTEFGLSETEMKSISDHFPVYIEITM